MKWFTNTTELVKEALSEQLAHEAVHKEPVDNDQRYTSVLLRTEYKFRLKGRDPPENLHRTITAVLYG